MDSIRQAIWQTAENSSGRLPAEARAPSIPAKIFPMDLSALCGCLLPALLTPQLIGLWSINEKSHRENSSPLPGSQATRSNSVMLRSLSKACTSASALVIASASSQSSGEAKGSASSFCKRLLPSAACQQSYAHRINFVSGALRPSKSHFQIASDCFPIKRGLEGQVRGSTDWAESRSIALFQLLG